MRPSVVPAATKAWFVTVALGTPAAAAYGVEARAPVLNGPESLPVAAAAES